MINRITNRFCQSSVNSRDTDRMTELVTGQFYWVQPASDPDEDHKTLTGVQPALYAGKCASGEDTWICLGLDEPSAWPMRWVGGVPPSRYSPI